MTSLGERTQIVNDIKEASRNGARLRKSCEVVGITLRTFQRWIRAKDGDQRPNAVKVNPKTLTKEEKKEIIKICNSNEYSHLTPNEIVPKLAETGIYIASESSFYKVLREEKLLKHRSNCKPVRVLDKPAALVATGPNQVWSWDITYLKTSVRGIYFYLYLFMDIWSRKIVGWTIEESENGELASKIVERICIEHDIDSIYLHSDNGGPMTCGTMQATLERLGVTPSYSRPRVSNDNPFSESLFKTLKYRPSFPEKFNSIDEAKKWINEFVDWYNTEHMHSGIKFVTPDERHYGQDKVILEKRNETYKKAKGKNPIRWAKETRNWEFQKVVKLNKIPEKIKIKKIA